jgi:hypothetical protein
MTDNHDEQPTPTEQIVSTVEVALAEGTDARPVEFLRIGVFTDANGKTVEIDQAKLDALVATFETGEAGQDVPIDILHRREEAAGWVRSVYQQDGKLFAVPEWNNLGKQLVGDKMYRYLSATIDLARNVLKSISLVNFPAVKGLRPVELAEIACDFAQLEVERRFSARQLRHRRVGRVHAWNEQLPGQQMEVTGQRRHRVDARRVLLRKDARYGLRINVHSEAKRAPGQRRFLGLHQSP